MLPTVFRSSPRSISSSTRTPDSSVATRVSYGAAFTTISLLAFCIALPAAGGQPRRPPSRPGRPPRAEGGVPAGRAERGEALRGRLWCDPFGQGKRRERPQGPVGGDVEVGQA